MGFFDSKSSANTTSQNAGFSEVAGPAVSLNLTGGGKNSSQATTVNMLDGGAVAGAFQFAGDALERSLRQVEVSGSNTASIVGNAVQKVAESARSETENVLLQGGKWLVIAVVAVAGFYALGKMKG